jgi:hypothetical protein
MNATRDSEFLPAVIAPLARRIAAIREQMHALGMFANDRELLDCPNCGLREDVLISGVLITYREPAFHEDIGLRFEELTGTLSVAHRAAGPCARRSPTTRIRADLERKGTPVVPPGRPHQIPSSRSLEPADTAG